MGRIISSILLTVILLGTFLMQGCNSGTPEDAGNERSPNAKGELFIIGGGHRPQSMMARMLKEAGVDSSGYIVILPHSSSQPDTAWWYANKQFEELTGRKAVNMNISPGDVNYRQKLDSIRQAQLIYITGGDQRRFIDKIKGTSIERAIQEAYRQGAVVAGTSAGAAVMSKVMLTGDERFVSEYEPTFNCIWKGNAIYDNGLGLIDWAIVDQHFIKRSRYNRLLSAMFEHPGKWGIGIDESTAVIINGRGLQVVGKNQVVLIEPAREMNTKNKRIGLSGVELHLLLPGSHFNAKNNEER